MIADTVAAPLEQVINGVDGMLYMNTQMAIDGRMVISIAFEQGTDPDMAQIQVQTGYPARCLACPKKSSELAL